MSDFKISLRRSPEDDNPLNAVIELPRVYRLGEYLYRANDDGGNYRFVLDINVNHPRALDFTIDGPKSLRIAVHPESERFQQMMNVINVMRGHGCWKYEYGEDKSFVFDSTLTVELADKVNAYRLTF